MNLSKNLFHCRLYGTKIAEQPCSALSDRKKKVLGTVEEGWPFDGGQREIISYKDAEIEK